MGIRCILLSFILSICLNVKSQYIYSGRVIDLVTQRPVEGAMIQVQDKDIATTSDNLGEFRINFGLDSLSDGEIKIKGNTIFWDMPASSVLNIYNSSGQKVFQKKLNIGVGETNMDDLNIGVYILRAEQANGKSILIKFYKNNRYFVTSPASIHEIVNDLMPVYPFYGNNILITREGYYPQEYRLSNYYSDYEIMPSDKTVSADYLDKLIQPESFKLMEGPPLNPVFSEIKSIKVIYSIDDGKIYYTNSGKFFIHYDFARDLLNYKKGHEVFNQEQYTNNANRLYYLATLNHFTASDIYTLDFFAGDELDCSQIQTVYNKIVETTYIGSGLKFYSNNLKWMDCSSIPTITSDELFAGQNYQPLNPEETYGYLKKYTLEELNTNYAGRHDIVLLNGIPNDISVVAGIITTEFQTPLSHINVLSHNRGAPNMALRDGWTNPLLEELNNKLVYLKVTLDTFILHEASITDAQAFWDEKEPSGKIILRHDTLSRGLINLSEVNVESDTVIGGKAANFSELMKINVSGYDHLPLPEGAFAIPFYYYWQHIHSNHLDIFIKKMLGEPGFYSDFQYRKTKLQNLQDSIRMFPIDPELLALVNSKISENGTFGNIRFRSSTNSEDIKGFNGAGLYDSFTGIPGDSEKTIEKAIKDVWASLWNLPAFEEREYFKIDQQSVAMAVLVHRSFKDELANGVVVTENLYNKYNPGFTINVQNGEISITNPEGGYTPDQIIWYTFDNVVEYINHSNAPGMSGKTVLSNSEITELAAYCQAIHNHYCMLNSECIPMDIEFKVDLINNKRKIYIKQARIY
jgi:pyruvate, water dikinase